MPIQRGRTAQLGNLLQPLPCPLGPDLAQHLRAQPYRHTHTAGSPQQQQVEQHLGGDFPEQLKHVMRRQHAHPADHRGQVDEQQRLVAENQQSFGNRLMTELQERSKLGLGEVLQELFAVGLDVCQPLVQLRNTVPEAVKHVFKAPRISQLQRGVALAITRLGIALPYRLERARPLTAQVAFQRADLGLIGGIQCLDVIPGNVGIKADSILPVDGALGDFENAAGADGLMDGIAEGTTVLRDFLQHHRRIADGHEPCALEHVHQGQR